MPSLIGTNNYLVPASGTTHGYPVNEVLSATPLKIDFRTIELDGEQFVPSGVYIDNTAGTADAVVLVLGMNYRIVCAPGTRLQAQYPAPIDQSVELTGNGLVSMIFVDYPVIPYRETTGGAATAVTIGDGANVTFGAVADVPAPNDTGNFTFMGFVKRISANITNLFVTGANAQTVQGNTAAGVADTGAPVKVGFLANNAAPAVVGNGSRVDAWSSTNGALVVAAVPITPTDGYPSTFGGFPTSTNATPRPTITGSLLFNGTTWDRQRGDLQGAFTQQDVSQDWAYTAAAGGITNNTPINIKGGVASTTNYLSAISYQNTSAVSSEINITAGGVSIWRGIAPASMSTPAVVTFPRPLRGTVASALAVTVLTTGTVTYFNAQGFTK